jgi:hypothetical protein
MPAPLSDGLPTGELRSSLNNASPLTFAARCRRCALGDRVSWLGGSMFQLQDSHHVTKRLSTVMVLPHCGHACSAKTRECNFEVRMAEDRVLENFVDGAGRLASIPVQHKKRLVVLKWLVEDFQPGRLYEESEVNRIIRRRHPDFAALRRYLIDEELMQRRRGVYWRTGSVPNVGYDPPSWPEL